jgi:hypothetical protein
MARSINTARLIGRVGDALALLLLHLLDKVSDQPDRVTVVNDAFSRGWISQGTESRMYGLIAEGRISRTNPRRATTRG